jgi:4-hydroxy 2-oxovalerate aldolase
MFFHSHNNTNQSLTVAQYILSNVRDHDFVIDASLMGMGKCAGNLHTEHLVKAYNTTLGGSYDADIIIETITQYIAPLKDQFYWGPNIYYYITALNYMHANYATFFLECVQAQNDFDKKKTAADFLRFINTIPAEMKTTCKRPYVNEMYEAFIKRPS